jgi:hypothetical protein
MSTTLAALIEHATVDGSFGAQLRSDPEPALAGYTLAPDEKAALLSPEPSHFWALGVDVRMSKCQDSQSIVDDGSS